MRTTHLDLLALEAADLEGLFRECGAKEVDVAGAYDGRPYEREKSVDLVMTVSL